MLGLPNFHALANLFPLMEGEAFESFTADVKANGLREPITPLDGAILDGRNRFQACKQAGIEPRYENYEGGDPLGFILSVNVSRRHLTASQRTMVAARLETTQHGGDRKSRQDAQMHLDRKAA